MKNILLFAILTTCIVAAWIGLSVYHNSSTSTIAPATDIQIKKIPPTFDNKVVEGLGKRKAIPVDLHQQTIQVEVSPTGQPVITPTVSLLPLAPQIVASGSSILPTP